LQVSIASAQTVSRLALPATITFDGLYAAPNGQLFAAGGHNGDTIYEISPQGTAAPFATGIDGPIHLAMNEAGELFVSSFNNQTIYKVGEEGELEAFVVTPLSYPAGMVFGPDGTLFVANTEPSYGLGGITRIQPDGTAEIFVRGRGVDRPVGLAIDPDGNLYAANAFDRRINKISPSGEVTLFAESRTQVFSTTIGHMVYANGYLYASEVGHHQIVRFDSQGQLEVLAGDGTMGNQNGPALSAQFVRPHGLTISPDGGTMYVASLSPQNSLRVISLAAATDAEAWVDLPSGIDLDANYPNPFNPQTTIHYSLRTPQHVQLVVFDTMGKEVARLQDGPQVAGEYDVRFNASGLPSGSYVYRLAAGDEMRSGVMTLLK